LPARAQGQTLEVAGAQWPRTSAVPDGEALEVFVRPEDLVVEADGDWQATVGLVQRSGPRQRLRARLAGATTELEVELPADAPAYAAGQSIRLGARRYGVFPAAAG